jgi:hypothetical protein
MPDSVRKLLEALIEMLLDRRQRESGLGEAHYARAWATLGYEQRRNIVRAIAVAMVTAEASSIATSEAHQIVEAELDRTTSHSAADAAVVLRSLLERSGMLREARPTTESSEGVIDFIHNTFKEFLAGEAFAERGAVEHLMHKCTSDGTWRRVALFAVACGGAEFPSRFLSAWLIHLSQLVADAVETRRAAELFCLQCRAVAARLDPGVMAQVEVLLTQIFPPPTVEEGELIASIGEIAVPFLRNQPQLSATQAAGCVRALRLINSTSARALLPDYIEDRRESVLQELAYWVNPLTLPAIRDLLVEGDNLPFWLAGQITDLGPLAELRCSRLNLQGSGIESMATLPTLPDVTSLDVSGTQITSLAEVGRLPSLVELSAIESRLTDLGGVEGLTGLTHIDVSDTLIESLWPLRRLERLRELRAAGTRIESVGTLNARGALEVLCVPRTRITELDGLANYECLKCVDIADTKVTDIGCVGRWSSLTDLIATRTPISSVAPLARLPWLRTLELDGSTPADLAILASANELATLVVGQISQHERWELRHLVRLVINGQQHASWTKEFARDSIFMSYAHEQRDVLDALGAMLKPAVGAKLVPSAWSDVKLEPSDEWRTTLTRNVQ